MRYVRIPGTDLVPSSICLGTSGLGSTITREDSFALLDAFLDAGGTFLDTAHIYADWISDIPGISERTIGAWASERGCADRVLIATKGGHPTGDPPRARLAPEDIRADLTESLRRLGVPSVGLYLLHRDDVSRPVEEILGTLETFRREGLVRWYAASNWTTDRMREASACARRLEIPGMVASQIRWSLARMNPEAVFDPTTVEMDGDTFSYHVETGLPVMAFTSQASGFFSGRYSREDPCSGRSDVRDMFASRANWERLARARSLAEQMGRTPNQIALAWLMAQPFPVFPIVGSGSISQMEDSCAAAEVNLTEQQAGWLYAGVNSEEKTS